MTNLDIALEKRLLAYAAAASTAVLTITVPAAAEIVYTPSNTPLGVPIGSERSALTSLDLNNDGIVDFSFSNYYYYFASSFKDKLFRWLAVSGQQTGNAVAVVQGPNKVTAAAVPAGKQIGPGANFAAGRNYMAQTKFEGSFFYLLQTGSWRTLETAFVGLKFLINGQVHYGWARIKFPQPGESIFASIYGYAYESVPNKPIIAGQTSASATVPTAEQTPTLGNLAAGAPAINRWRSGNNR